eukprot:tig00020616_g12252.t1
MDGNKCPVLIAISFHFVDLPKAGPIILCSAKHFHPDPQGSGLPALPPPLWANAFSAPDFFDGIVQLVPTLSACFFPLANEALSAQLSPAPEHGGDWILLDWFNSPLGPNAIRRLLLRVLRQLQQLQQLQLPAWGTRIATIEAGVRELLTFLKHPSLALGLRVAGTASNYVLTLTSRPAAATASAARVVAITINYAPETSGVPPDGWMQPDRMRVSAMTAISIVLAAIIPAATHLAFAFSHWEYTTARGDGTAAVSPARHPCLLYITLSSIFRAVQVGFCWLRTPGRFAMGSDHVHAVDGNLLLLALCCIPDGPASCHHPIKPALALADQIRAHELEPGYLAAAAPALTEAVGAAHFRLDADATTNETAIVLEFV